jgi:hypothetical protein
MDNTIRRLQEELNAPLLAVGFGTGAAGGAVATCSPVAIGMLTEAHRTAGGKP